MVSASARVGRPRLSVSAAVSVFVVVLDATGPRLLAAAGAVDVAVAGAHDLGGG